MGRSTLLCLLASLVGLSLSIPAFADFNRVEETHPYISYEGGWWSAKRWDASGDTVAASANAGAKASISFNGTGIRWITYRCQCANGIARVYLDGILEATVQGANPLGDDEPLVAAYTVSGLPDAAHVLTIEVLGQRAYDGGNAYVVLDAFYIENSSGADSTPPEVALLLSPGIAHDEIGIGEDVFDNSLFVADVRLYVDGVLIDDGDRAWYLPTKWDTRTVADGNHVMTAVAVDAAGNEGHSAAVNFVVDNASDWVGPIVKLTAPAANSQVTGMVTLNADAIDNFGVTRVTFHAALNGQRVYLGEDATAPYSITRDSSGVPSGTVVYVWATGYDAAGHTSSSVGTKVTVQH